MVDASAVEEWIRGHTELVGGIQTVHERPLATVLRVPVVDGVAWFKACAPVQAFEPRLTAELFVRWPDRVAEVLAYDEERAWLLLADAGRPVGTVGNPPEAWLAALRARSPICGSGPRCRRSNDPCSTAISRSCCGAPSPRPSAKASA